MTSFFYIVTEGVHDVAFVGKLLSVVHGANRIRKLEDLDDALRGWVKSSFAWPKFIGKHHDIERLAVPAPVFYRLPAGMLVALRNAQGISEIGTTLSIDFEAFTRVSCSPGAVGVVLDSDDEPVNRRFEKVKATLESVNLVAPAALGDVSDGSPRVGVFALPEPGVVGTLEDVLLSLGDVAYPELTALAREYASQCRRMTDGDPAGRDWREIRKPSGEKKATISAVTAVLKPGRSMQVSLDDNRWVGEETTGAPCLRPCLAFLKILLANVVPPREAAR